MFKKKPIIQVIMPDTMEKPSGGLGEQFKNIHKRLCEQFDFDIVGQIEKNNIPNYYSVESLIPELEQAHAGLYNYVAQSSYGYAGMKLRKPDLIHGNDWSCYIASYHSAMFHKVPLLVSMNLSIRLLKESGIYACSDFKSYDGYYIQKGQEMVEKSGLESADRIVQISHAYAKKFMPFADKTTVIPNGIDTKIWKKKEDYKFEGTDGNLKVVYIGRFASQKGVDLILKSELPPNVDLFFIGGNRGGDINLYQNVVKLAAEKSNVFYLGEKYGQEKIDILFAADAVLMPSRHEPFGIVGLEAMASNNILITTFDNGIADYCNEDIGIKCGLHEDSISWALLKFSQMSKDERKRRTDKGREIAMTMDWDDIVKQYADVYNEMLNRKS